MPHFTGTKQEEALTVNRPVWRYALWALSSLQRKSPNKKERRDTK
jgi:hypothetical protein